MRKIIVLIILATALPAHAALVFSNVSYTGNSVTFDVNGDMSGYATPPSPDQLSIVYLGDIWSGNNTFDANTWSRSVFDNNALSTPGNTGTSNNNYTWSGYVSSLATGVVSNATVTVSMNSIHLNAAAANPIIDFVWGNGGGNFTSLQSVNVLNQAAVPVPAPLAMLGAGLLMLGALRNRKKRS